MAGKAKKLDLTLIYEKVLNMLVYVSPDRVTFSQVARSAKVPRATLYYYFGNSVSSLLHEALVHGMKTYARFNEFDQLGKYSTWEKFQEKRLAKALRLVQKYPWAPALYFRYRHSAGAWGATVREIELEYCRKISHAWKHFHGKNPNETAVHLSSYFKLGFLWGVCAESEIWSGKSETKRAELLEKMSVWLTQVTGADL